jgi:hypothetical protein
MTLSTSGYFGWAGGGKNGAIVDLWAQSRFGSPPQENSAPPDPDPPDAGPVTTGINFGGPGAYTISTIPSVQDYYLRIQYGGNSYWGVVSAQDISGQPPPSEAAGIISSLSYQTSQPYAVVNTQLAEIDFVNLVLPTFVAPASGVVRVEWSAYVNDATPIGLAVGVVFTGAGTIASQDVILPSGPPWGGRVTFDAILTGLDIGTAYNLQLAGNVLSAGTVYLGHYGPITAYVTVL